MLATLALVAAGGALAGLVTALRRAKPQSFMTQPRTKPLFLDLIPSRFNPPSRFNEVVQREYEITEEAANRYILISAATVGIATLASLGVGSTSLFALPLLLYLFWPILRAGYQEITVERKVGFFTINAILFPLLLITGYIFTASIYIFLHYLAEKLMSATRRKSEEALTNIFKDIPNTAWILVDGVETEVAIAQIETGDLVVVQAGQVIPIDGEILRGYATVDQQMLTGEAQPAEKAPGDRVFAATSILAGKIVVQVERKGAATVAAEIEELLINTTSYESRLELRGLAIADKTALPLLLLSAATWPLMGANSAMAVLFCYFGIDLRVTAPLSVFNFLWVASRRSILVKDGRSLETLHAVDTIVFDKTGTLTKEQPHVAHIYTYNGYDRAEVLQYAAAIEAKQTHPIAHAICKAAAEHEVDIPLVTETVNSVGFGLKAVVAGKAVCIGSLRFMHMEAISIPNEGESIQSRAYAIGHSLVYLSIDREVVGIIELQPTVRAEVKSIIQTLKQRGMKTYIISGDHHGPTQHLADSLGIHGFYAEVLPEEKARLVEQLQQGGRTVCFVGDGINDSIALKKANVSISLRGASTIATDTAQIVFLDESLNSLPRLFEIADSLQMNMRGNLMWAVVPGCILLSGIYLFHLGAISTMLLSYTTFGGALVNAMLPRFSKLQELTEGCA